MLPPQCWSVLQQPQADACGQTHDEHIKSVAEARLKSSESSESSVTPASLANSSCASCMSFASGMGKSCSMHGVSSGSAWSMKASELQNEELFITSIVLTTDLQNAAMGTGVARHAQPCAPMLCLAKLPVQVPARLKSSRSEARWHQQLAK